MSTKKIPPNPDDSLRMAIIASLIADSSTASIDIRVGVQNGIAHLAGTVNSYQEWARAEELTRKVPGIRGVVNRIDAPGAPSPAVGNKPGSGEHIVTVIKSRDHSI